MTGRMTSFGVDEILLKPFNKESVASVVQKWLGGVAEMLKLVEDAPALDISQMAPPDFIISGLVKPRTARVLVVEDCKLTQHVIIGLLSKLTSNVSQAFDGEQAVEMCHRHQFDLILMDMAMPKLNGLEATQHIRTSGKNMYAPIVAFTSSGTLEDYTAYGVNDMLQKPFTKEMLSNIFDKWTAYIKQLDDIDEAGLFGGADADVIADAAPASAAAAAPPPLPAVPSAPVPAVPRATAEAAEPAATKSAQKQAYQPLGLGLPMPNLPFNNRAGKTGGGRRKKGAPRIIHNRKEQHRRKQITHAAEELSKMIPNLPAGDKATVLMSAVDYVKMLRTSLGAAALKAVDAQFKPHSQPPDS